MTRVTVSVGYNGFATYIDDPSTDPPAVGDNEGHIIDLTDDEIAYSLDLRRRVEENEEFLKSKAGDKWEAIYASLPPVEPRPLDPNHIVVERSILGISEPDWKAFADQLFSLAIQRASDAN